MRDYTWLTGIPIRLIDRAPGVTIRAGYIDVSVGFGHGDGQRGIVENVVNNSIVCSVRSP